MVVASGEGWKGVGVEGVGREGVGGVVHLPLHRLVWQLVGDKSEGEGLRFSLELGLGLGLAGGTTRCVASVGMGCTSPWPHARGPQYQAVGSV